MPSAELERVPAFEFPDTILIKHYFDSNEIFNKLKPYYNNNQYRFEIPKNNFDNIEDFLQNQGYKIDLIQDTDPFVVVVKQYSAHPENIFKDSVLHRSRDGYNFFLMTDQIVVAEAVSDGAIRVTKTALENPFPTT